MGCLYLRMYINKNSKFVLSTSPKFCQPGDNSKKDRAMWVGFVNLCTTVLVLISLMLKN